MAFAVDCIKLTFVCMIFSTWGLYELQGLFDRANRPRSEDRDRDNPDAKNPNLPTDSDDTNDKNPK